MTRTIAAVLLALAFTAVPAYAGDDVIGIITDAANAHGVDAGWMVRIARCESTLNPRAVNGQYLGLYQLGYGMQKRFWASGHADLWDAAEQSDFVASELVAGNASAWECA